MTGEHVEPQEEVQEVAEPVEQEAEQQVEQGNDEPVEKQTQVPLSALQKERQKRKEVELELQWERQRGQQKAPEAPQEEDLSAYEPVTKADLAKAQKDSVRLSEEQYWIRSNPEKYEYVNENLEKFLKQRPNLTSAIDSAGNRFEEAYTLMNALTPRQQASMQKAAPPKRDAPFSPTGVPKGASLNEAVDVMQMSDKEFGEWRHKARRR